MGINKVYFFANQVHGFCIEGIQVNKRDGTQGCGTGTYNMECSITLGNNKSSVKAEMWLAFNE